MANQNDSFIDEVTEELRRDRLYLAFRRFGWIAILLIVALVAGAAWREYAADRAEAAARTWGDAVLASETAPERLAALEGIDPQGAKGRKLLSEMLAAGVEAESGLTAQAAERLRDAAEGVKDDRLLHDLALLKAVMIAGSGMDAAERDAILAELSKAGAPFELLALEQKAVALIAAGRTEDASVLIRQIQQKDGLSEPLRRRLAEVMIALGEEPEQADGVVPQSMPVAPSQ
ncbi:hypothetical protein [Paracoccus ravus]|uniref:hypothetical protein n=1 Tax=Paracoccus ravus TaxID=2447760 RepID=UPI00106E001B|nr:hypothetical protein [Paracoccus ravus]